MTLTAVNDTLKKYEGSDNHLIIPEGIRVIGDYAFSGARSLRSIVIPDTVEEIGTNAFYDCEGLQEMILPDSVNFISSAVFSRCSSLKKVVFPDCLTSLARIVFYRCESLEEVHLPLQLKRIGRACFEQCHSLKKIVLPEGIKVLENNVFDDCTALEEVFLPDSLEEIGDNVFFNCRSLREIRIPSSLKTAGKGAFETRGRLKLVSHSGFFIRSQMLDNNWNLYWNFGANGRYNGRNELNYQLHDSFLPHVNLAEFKPEAQCILAVCYLEAWQETVAFYEDWIRDNRQTVTAFMVKQKRYQALNRAMELDLISGDDIAPHLDEIHDRVERAHLLETQREKQRDILSETDLDDLF